jgi:hypothetical protein
MVMDSLSPLSNLNSKQTLAVLVTPNGYFVFPKWETYGIISGLGALTDEDVEKACEQGIVMADGRHLNDDQMSRLSYLNTSTPVPNSAAGPGGTRNLMHVDAWLSVCTSCGLDVHNAKPPALDAAMFTKEYATRLMKEGLLESNEAQWSVPASDSFQRTLELKGTICNIPADTINGLSVEPMKTKFENIVIGESIIANLKGEGDRAAVSKSKEKSREWIDYCDIQIKKVPALNKKIPVYEMKRCARLIAKELDSINQNIGGPSI